MFPYHQSTDATQDQLKSKKEHRKSRRSRARTPIPTSPKDDPYISTFPALVEQTLVELPGRSRRRKARTLSPEHGTTSCSPVHTDEDDEYYGMGCVDGWLRFEFYIIRLIMAGWRKKKTGVYNACKYTAQALSRTPLK